MVATTTGTSYRKGREIEAGLDTRGGNTNGVGRARGRFQEEPVKEHAPPAVRFAATSPASAQNSVLLFTGLYYENINYRFP